MLDKLKKLFKKEDKMNFKEGVHYSGNALQNEKFIVITTRTYIFTDFFLPIYYLLPNEDDKVLGESILKALSKSRFLLTQDEKTIYNWEYMKVKSDEWDKYLMKTYGYKTKTALFQNMDNCGIRLENGVIKIIPFIHERLQGWMGFSSDERKDVFLSLDNTPEELGAGLKLAFSRCIPLPPKKKKIF